RGRGLPHPARAAAHDDPGALVVEQAVGIQPRRRLGPLAHDALSLTTPSLMTSVSPRTLSPLARPGARSRRTLVLQGRREPVQPGQVHAVGDQRDVIAGL